MKNNQPFYQSPTFIHLAIGVLVGALISFVSILVCAFILTLRDFEPSTAIPLSNVCLAIGSAVGGYVCALTHRTKGLIMGALVGLIMFLIITVIALIANGISLTINTPIRFAVMTMLSAAGGVVGVNRSSKRKMI